MTLPEDAKKTIQDIIDKKSVIYDVYYKKRNPSDLIFSLRLIYDVDASFYKPFNIKTNYDIKKNCSKFNHATDFYYTSDLDIYKIKIREIIHIHPFDYNDIIYLNLTNKGNYKIFIGEKEIIPTKTHEYYILAKYIAYDTIKIKFLNAMPEQYFKLVSYKFRPIDIFHIISNMVLINHNLYIFYYNVAYSCGIVITDLYIINKLKKCIIKFKKNFMLKNELKPALQKLNQKWKMKQVLLEIKLLPGIGSEFLKAQERCVLHGMQP